MAIRVLAVDDSAVFVDALSDVLDACPDFELVGAARTGESALELARTVRPDLVLIDVLLPGIDGIETCRRMRNLRPGAHLILCSVGEDPRPPGECSDATFLAKADISPRTLRAAWLRRPVAAMTSWSTTAAPPHG
jgi:DNA-binding NarL/FixJ family response regulator